MNRDETLQVSPKGVHLT